MTCFLPSAAALSSPAFTLLYQALNYRCIINRDEAKPNALPLLTRVPKAICLFLLVCSTVGCLVWLVGSKVGHILPLGFGCDVSHVDQAYGETVDQ
jgi:hypothetical protein